MMVNLDIHHLNVPDFLTRIDVDDVPAKVSKDAEGTKSRRWVNYITYDGK